MKKCEPKKTTNTMSKAWDIPDNLINMNP